MFCGEKLVTGREKTRTKTVHGMFEELKELLYGRIFESEGPKVKNESGKVNRATSQKSL